MLTDATNIYLISGLGADWRLYKNLEFPTKTVVIHVEWIAPRKSESLTEYAKRLSEKIDDSKPFFLIGLSFGGMVAIEMNKYIKPIKTIIISSAKTGKEIPFYYKAAGRCFLPEIAPMFLVKNAHFLTYWIFGMKTKEEKALLKQVFKEMDSWFIRWSTHHISYWKNTQIPENLFHIHGSADKVLPLKFVKPDIVISRGEHLMVYSMAKKISEIIADEISS